MAPKFFFAYYTVHRILYLADVMSFFVFFFSCLVCLLFVFILYKFSSVFKLVFIFRAVFAELQFEVFAERKIFTMTIVELLENRLRMGFGVREKDHKKNICYSEK